MKSRREMFDKVKSNVDEAIWNDIIKYRRRQGNSTAQALKLIGQAMSEPNSIVKITDQCPGFLPGNNRLESIENKVLREHFIPLMVDCIERLELVDLYINKSNLTLTYDLSYLK